MPSSRPMSSTSYTSEPFFPPQRPISIPLQSQDQDQDDYRQRRDSASTFFGRDNMRPSAGYNRQSFAVPPESEEPVRWGDGRERREEQEDGEKEEFDVYADFNNMGGRVSESRLGQAEGYRPVSTARPFSTHSMAKPTLLPSSTSTLEAGAPMEYVTVPTLGAEWRADELRDMTRAGRNEDKRDERMRKWRAWRRDQAGLFGKWGTRRGIVWALFGTCVVSGILIAILLPRAPGIDVFGNNPLTAPPTSANLPAPAFSRTPANFTWYADLAVQVDTSSQVVLPLHISSLQATVWDIDTNVAVGTATLNSVSVPAKTYAQVTLPVVFQYQAVNASDTTWSTFRSACGPQWVGTTRPGLNLRFQIFMNIAGLVGSPQTAVSLSAVDCPITLPANAP